MCIDQVVGYYFSLHIRSSEGKYNATHSENSCLTFVFVYYLAEKLIFIGVQD